MTTLPLAEAPPQPPRLLDLTGRIRDSVNSAPTQGNSRCPLIPFPLAAVMRHGQKLKTTFSPIARALGTALLPPGLMRY